LAKFSRQDDSYNQPSIEFANMTLASKAGIDIPETLLLTLPGGGSVYLIERFDRSPGPKKTIIRHPFISALTAVGGHESDFNRWGYSDLAAFIFKEVNQSEKDLHQLFRRMIFNVLTGNTDDHLRNYGFLLDEKTATWRLSPAYDIVPQAGLHSAEKYGFLKLASGRQATIENALGLAADCGLTDQEAKKITREILNVVKDWRSHYHSHGVSGREIEALENAFFETIRLASDQTRT
jgi:serine/threonine-protein kinase HipA